MSIINDNDLSEMIKNISKMISEDNIPDEMKSILSNLNSNSSSNETNKEDSSSNSSTIDFNTILKMKSTIDKINSSEDPRANLLRSLKPYLKESRKSKIEQYIQLFNISKIMEIFYNTGGDLNK